MSEQPLRPVYLLTGTDTPKVRRALQRLRARFEHESVEVVPAETTTGEDAVALVNALGLFGGGRLVVVEGVERWKRADYDAVETYLAAPVEGAVLALVAGEIPRESTLAKLVAKHGSVLVYDVPKPRDPSVWVRGELERLGASAAEGAARRLVDVVGDDVAVLAGEVEKVATWAGGERVEPRDVEALAVPAHEPEPWLLTDAWGARDTARALAACELALEHSEPFVVALSLATHVRRVRAAQLLAAEGMGAREVAKRLRIKEYPARKALAHAERYSSDELDAAIVRLAELDAAIKGASRLAAELELELALVDVTRSREPATRT